MTRLYAVSPAILPDLFKAVALNYSKHPVVLQQVGSDDRGYLLLDIKAYGQTAVDVARLCDMAERQVAIILPAFNKRSNYIGVEGEHLDFDGTLYHVGCWTSKFGTQYIHRFADEAENEITWKTSRPQELGVYRVSCRIKGHSDFGGIQQTTVTHCKLERLK